MILQRKDSLLCMVLVYLIMRCLWSSECLLQLSMIIWHHWSFCVCALLAVKLKLNSVTPISLRKSCIFSSGASITASVENFMWCIWGSIQFEFSETNKCDSISHANLSFTGKHFTLEDFSICCFFGIENCFCQYS